MNYLSRFTVAAAALVFVGAGCAASPTTETRSLSSGPFVSVTNETYADGSMMVTLDTRASATASDFYDTSKLPMPAVDFYSENPVAGLGAAVRTYDDEDGDANRLFSVKGGSLATIEIDGDENAIVEYRPDSLAASAFLSADVMTHVPASGEVFLRVLNEGDEDDILFLVDIKDGTVVSISP